MFRYLPEQGSDFAPTVDSIHHLITDLSVGFTVAIVGAMLYFAIRYRRKNGVDHETPRILGSHFLEIVWTVVPTIICIWIAVYGVVGYRKMRQVPPGAIEINVVGRQWAWSFEYPNGRKVADEFWVPVDTPIKLIMTSEDVLHSFFVPGMRTKMDVIKGQYTYEWFRPVKTGDFQVYCTEYCGTSHSAMLAKMHVVSHAEYQTWLSDTGRVKSVADQGEEVAKLNGCFACHSVDGTRKIGPSFLQLFGRKARWDDGTEYTVDENYIRESVLNPQARIVEGYPRPSPMGSFEGKVSDGEITKLIEYFKSLKEAPREIKLPSAKVDLSKLSPAERGKLLYQSKACIGCHSLDGTKVVGPSFKAIYGRAGEFVDGAKYEANDAYIKESIVNPNAHVVAGYPSPSPMPPYQGQLSEEEIADIIEFMKTVK
jgi:cytochrome c oxidase subunit 2